MSFWPDGVSIVAEIGPNHNGSLDNARRLIEEAQAAGATHVKFQASYPDELVALRGNGPAPEPWNHLTMRELYEAAQTPLDWFRLLAKHCDLWGVPWFASVVGPVSLAALEAVGCPAYKLAAMEWGNDVLRAMVLATGKPIVASTPLESYQHPWWDLRVETDQAIYCPPGYPQPEARLYNLWGEEGDRYKGYSYHGTDTDIPAFAVAAGARYIETHLQLEDEPSKFEAEFAFTPSGFAEMVRWVRKAEAAL